LTPVARDGMVDPTGRLDRLIIVEGAVSPRRRPGTSIGEAGRAATVARRRVRNDDELAQRRLAVAGVTLAQISELVDRGTSNVNAIRSAEEIRKVAAAAVNAQARLSRRRGDAARLAAVIVQMHVDDFAKRLGALADKLESRRGSSRSKIEAQALAQTVRDADAAGWPPMALAAGLYLLHHFDCLAAADNQVAVTRSRHLTKTGRTIGDT
jgi:hypothetical protein